MTSKRTALLRIVSRDQRGRPKTCEIVHDDETVDVSSGAEHFITVRIDDALLDPYGAAVRRDEDAISKTKPRRH